jgi:hypothetical protein
VTKKTEEAKEQQEPDPNAVAAGADAIEEEEVEDVGEGKSVKTLDKEMEDLRKEIHKQEGGATAAQIAELDALKTARIAKKPYKSGEGKKKS